MTHSRLKYNISYQDAIAELNLFLTELKEDVSRKTKLDTMREVVAHIEQGEMILKANSFFVCQGDLAKVFQTGQREAFRFFLFSDWLLYTHKAPEKGMYKIQDALALTKLEVADYCGNPSGRYFSISFATKSILIEAVSVADKLSWVREVQRCVCACKKRCSDHLPMFSMAQLPAAAMSGSGKPNSLDLRSALIDFYTKVKPANLGRVDKNIAKYKGRELEMIDILERKYKAKFPTCNITLVALRNASTAQLSSYTYAHTHKKYAVLARFKIKIEEQQDDIISRAKAYHQTLTTTREYHRLTSFRKISDAKFL